MRRFTACRAAPNSGGTALRPKGGAKLSPGLQATDVDLSDRRLADQRSKNRKRDKRSVPRRYLQERLTPLSERELWWEVQVSNLLIEN
jgi:hypothetical protein